MIDLPVAFADYTHRLLGEKEYNLLVEALSEESPVSVRFHPDKWKYLFPAEVENVPWTTKGAYLAKRPSFTFDPLFHAGCYYVQEASSMFVEQILCTYVTAPCVMLDLCAAPGGKSTHARSVIPEGSLLVSNEVMRPRAQILAENIIKWGHPDMVVTQNDPVDFAPLQHVFDVILADVPCSGEGMFRKDSASISEWSPENVDTCWRRQRRIVADVWSCLKPGGLFIYSTCTYNAYEDEENIRWMMDELGAVPLEVPIRDEWGIKRELGFPPDRGEALPVYHFLPSHLRGEGFFIAALRKPINNASIDEQAFSLAGESSASFSLATKKKAKGGKEVDRTITVPTDCMKWLSHPADFVFEVNKTTLSAFPKNQILYLNLFRKYLKIMHAGIVVAEIKGRDWIPHHSLAMSLALNREVFPHVELSYPDAIAYLRREAIVLDNVAPHGFVLLTYKDVPLGFVKNIGNRANNSYPQEWRIRSGYIPDDEQSVF